MSLETTLARAASTAAADTWRAHERPCARCTSAARGRRWDDLCAAGHDLWNARRDRLAELQESIAADRVAAEAWTASTA